MIDEIHLLGADRGPILEVIVSRMRYISAQTGVAVRIVGLSTALSNAQDLADWLGIGQAGLFNFKPSVRPVPLEAHIQARHIFFIVCVPYTCVSLAFEGDLQITAKAIGEALAAAASVV